MAKTTNYDWTTYGDGVTEINFQTDITKFINDVDTKLKEVEESADLFDAGKLPRSVTLAESAGNGYARVRKNGSTTADYGTELFDYRANGSAIGLILSGSRIVARYRTAGGTTTDVTLHQF